MSGGTVSHTYFLLSINDLKDTWYLTNMADGYVIRVSLFFCHLSLAQKIH
jgi:hypothetical protein